MKGLLDGASAPPPPSGPSPKQGAVHQVGSFIAAAGIAAEKIKGPRPTNQPKPARGAELGG
ncbi:hypothetical protein GCM10009116_21300 [Brevundimonas basaltis]